MTKSAEPIIILHVKNTLQGGVAGRTIFNEMFQISGCGGLYGQKTHERPTKTTTRGSFQYLPGGGGSINLVEALCIITISIHLTIYICWILTNSPLTQRGPPPWCHGSDNNGYCTEHHSLIKSIIPTTNTLHHINMLECISAAKIYIKIYKSNK